MVSPLSGTDSRSVHGRTLFRRSAWEASCRCAKNSRVMRHIRCHFLASNSSKRDARCSNEYKMV